MSQQPDTGESVTAQTRRTDNDAWPHTLAALKKGATLHRPHKLDRYYAHNGRDYVSGTGISRARVRRLESEGVIVHINVDRYALAQDRSV